MAETVQQSFGGDAAAYDALPYLSLPVAYTQPSHLAAIARLHGLDAPDPAHARVLELGCATGGNILPMGARWPSASFQGVDISPRQIEIARADASRLGVKNVTLTCADIADLHVPERSFDYVICHGVFSWVPPAVQDAIFRLIDHCLSDSGVAAISYNVLPGWHLRFPIRDLMQSAAGPDGTPHERANRARKALQEAAMKAGRGLYAELLRDEAKRLAKMPASYLQGEFLAEHNHPISVTDFSSSASRHRLAFLCESDLDCAAIGLLSQDGRGRIGDLLRSDRVEAAREIDFASGRPFRRSLIIRQARLTEKSLPSAARLDGLHIACKLEPDAARDTEDRISFVDRYGRTITTIRPAIARAFRALGAVYPSTLHVRSLLDGAGEDRARVAHALLRLVEAGKAGLSAAPVVVGQETDAMPRAWAYARQQAEMGLPYVTNLHHVAVEVPKIVAAVLTRLDGSNDRNSLATFVAADIAAGRVRPPDHTRGQPLPAIQHHVSEALRFLASRAVLTASSRN